MDKLKKYRLGLLVFLSGASVMIYELVGSRVLGPSLGTSIFIWTSLIGIILLSIALGNYFGGRFADRLKSQNFLGVFLMIASLSICLTAFYKDPILFYCTQILPGIKAPAIAASLFLFTPAAFFLGTIAPYATRLQIENIENSGSTIGNLYALSTGGSIVGTFIGGFFLIPAFETTRLMFIIAIVLLLNASLVFSGSRKIYLWLFFALILAISIFGLIRKNEIPNYLVYDGNTKYSRIQIMDLINPWEGKDSVRLMKINNEFAAAQYKNKEGLVYRIMRMYSRDSLFTGEINEAIMLGGAGYIFPRHFLEAKTNARMDVIEIDEGTTELARRYFGLRDDARMEIFHEDARTYVNKCEKKYDAFYGDAYKSTFSVPYQLTTIEFMDKIKDMLRPDGVAFFNIISNLDNQRNLFFRAQLKTIKEVFPQVLVFAVRDVQKKHELQNMLIVARKTTDPDLISSLSRSAPDIFAHLITDSIPMADMEILRDDYAPAEFLVNKLIN